MKYPPEGTKEYKDLVLQKAKELVIAIESGIVRQSIFSRKSFNKK